MFVFLFPWKPKVCVKAILGLFFGFFHGKKLLSRTFFSLFSRTLFLFHGHFFELFALFTGTFLVSRTLFFFIFFHGHFHGHFFWFFSRKEKNFSRGKKNTALINFGKYREIYIFLIKIDFWPPGSIFCQNVEFLIFQPKNRSELRLFTISKDIRNKSSYQ